MTILILGAKGNLGTQLQAALTPDFSVIAWDREEVDALDFETLKQKIINLAPEIVINAIAYNAVDKCEADEAERRLAYRLNRDLPAILAQLAAELKFTLVHYSSDYVFAGNSDKLAFKEDDAVCPVNEYGLSKAAGEAEILKIASHQELKFYLIRTSKLFGPRGSSVAAKPSFFDIMLNLAQTGEELTIVGGELSCFTYTPDLALATKELILNQADYGIYHLTNSGPATWLEGAQELFRLKALRPSIKAVSSAELQRPATRPFASVLQNNKLAPLRSWQEALKEYLN